MKKTTIYLEPELDHALGRLAAKQHVSKAEVIRVALRDAARDVERPRMTGIGLALGPGDVADNVDRHLIKRRGDRLM
jgi:predicted transcriptional regulator